MLGDRMVYECINGLRQDPGKDWVGNSMANGKHGTENHKEDVEFGGKSKLK